MKQINKILAVVVILIFAISATSFATSLGAKQTPTQLAETTGLPPNQWVNLGIGGGEIDQIAVSQTDPNLIFVGGGWDGLWRTTNGGANWTEITPPGTSNDIQSLVLYNSTLYTTVLYHAFMSRDSGTTWQVIALNDASVGFFTDVATGSLYLLEQHGLFVLNGNGWQSVRAFPAPTFAYAGSGYNGTFYITIVNDLINNQYHSAVLVGHDGAWTESYPNFFQNFGVKYVAVDGSNPNYAIIDGNPTFTFTDDGGRTWQNATFTQMEPGTSGGFVGYQNGTLWAGRMLLYQLVGGEWAQATHFTNVNYTAISGGAYHVDVGMFLVQGGKEYIGTDGGLYVSSDGGHTWGWLSQHLYNALLTGAAVDPYAPSHILIFRQDWWPLQTWDMGRTWHSISVDWVEWGYATYGTAPGSVCITTRDRAVFCSTDYGHTFGNPTFAAKYSPPRSDGNATVVGTGAAIQYNGTAGTATTDVSPLHNASWRYPPSLFGQEVGSTTRIFAFQLVEPIYSPIFMSTDMGATWQDVTWNLRGWAFSGTMSAAPGSCVVVLATYGSGLQAANVTEGCR